MTTSAEDTLVLETTKGKVTIAMRPDLAPKHVARIKELVRQNSRANSMCAAPYRWRARKTRTLATASSSFAWQMPRGSTVNTPWGEVTSGMQNVDQIKRGEPVIDPDRIVSARMARDAA